MQPYLQPGAAALRWQRPQGEGNADADGALGGLDVWPVGHLL